MAPTRWMSTAVDSAVPIVVKSHHWFISLPKLMPSLLFHQTSHQAFVLVFSSVVLRSVPSTSFPPTWSQLNLPSFNTGITTQGPHLSVSLSLPTILLAAEEGIMTKHGLSPNLNSTSTPLGSRLFSAWPVSAHIPRPPTPLGSSPTNSSWNVYDLLL